MAIQVNTLCVLGAGTMGTGIAQVGAQAGLRVHVIETNEEAVPRSRKRLDKSLQGGIERGKLTPEQAEEVKQRITWGGDYAVVAEADWVIEAVFEDVEVKRQVWGQVAQRVRDGVPVASNTSTMPIKSLAAFFGQPERFVGMHFFNPPPAMKLVEVIPSDQTAPQVTEAAVALCERMGKTPLLAPDIPGFMVNRAFGALVAAAAEVWALGGEPAAIDQALELGLGHKMGPLRTSDLVGLDIIKAVHESLTELTGHDRFALPQRFYDELINQGKLGVKSGEGFYKYEE
ncbi:3-hydroxyacyl-CoA dehydrogenase family protein [bacterium]|nr:3-hydroxyacyl-CoA dehydrogenase family protein [bacterium]